jgi:YVTN family beta-propeller protein
MALTALIQRKRIGRRAVLVTLGIFGAGLFFGDGMITPAISVTSAVGGLNVVDPSTHNVFVANELSNSVSVIHEYRHSARVTATIPVAVGPFGVAVDPRSHHVYISTDGNSEVSVLREDCYGGKLTN